MLTGNDNTTNEKRLITSDTKLETMGLGMEMRVRGANYQELVGVPRSVYYQQAYTDVTERAMGMPELSTQFTFSRLTVAGGLQVSSTNVNDTSAGTGAQVIYIEGLVYNNGRWKQKTSVVANMNGQTAVQIGTDTDWYRITKVWVNTTGTGSTNAGDIYISPLGQALTLGVPDANVLQAVILGYSNSTGGFYSVPYGCRFNYTKGNFYSGIITGSTSGVIFHETFYQDFNGTGLTANMTKYEVATMSAPTLTTSYDYTGGAPYTGLTDIEMTVRITSGTSTVPKTYYVEYVLTKDAVSNL